jgi:transcriptional regulator with PAS, ATPase and Fis domain
VVSEIIPSSNDFPRVLPHRVVSEVGNPVSQLEAALDEIGLVVEHASMRKLVESAAVVAPVATSVLLLGETGTGKEMFARFIHALSNRSGRFVPLNCGAIPGELVESTLFGHRKGAFTGASENQIGKFEQAHDGTLLLDEIGELPLAAQVKLLRVLENREIEPVGANRSQPVDVRVIAATNRNLAEEVKARRFREDLYYRLCPITLTLPPLRARRSEITRIALYLLERLNRNFRRQRRFSSDALRRLAVHPWPGNVRQLEGVLRKTVILCPSDLIEASDLDLDETEVQSQLPQPFEGFQLDKFLEETRDLLIDRALEMAGGNQTQAGRYLGITGAGISKSLKSRSKRV